MGTQLIIARIIESFVLDYGREYSTRKTTFKRIFVKVLLFSQDISNISFANMRQMYIIEPSTMSISDGAV